MIEEAEWRNLPRMLAFVREGAERAGVNEQQVDKTEVAAEEVLSNIIKYAYQGRKGKIDLQVNDRGIVVIKDWGVPFNPLEQSASIDTETPLMARKVGDLGHILIPKLVPGVKYDRLAGANVLTLRA